MENFNGRPVWHVSISWQTPSGPTPLDSLRHGHLVMMRRAAMASLQGVGDGQPFTVDPQALRITFQLRKFLAPEEVALLPQDLLPACWIDHGVLRAEVER